MRMTRTILAGLVLALGTASATQTAKAHGAVTWQRCYLHLDWATMTRVTHQDCARFIIKTQATPVGHWRRCIALSPHVRKCVVYPTFQEIQSLPSAGGGQVVRLYTTYYCLTSLTASGRPGGPGIVASYILPWGSYVEDLDTGWTGYVLDHPDSHTQADEWLSCPRSFPTGYHNWKIIRS